MGLIERVAAEAGLTEAKVQTQIRLKAVIQDDAPQLGTKVEINFNRLAEQGFFNPETASKKHLLELRAVKRNLLKRIGLLHAGKKGRRGALLSGQRGNVILVTSTRPGEGKTFSAINLALSFAFEDRQPVLLIDGDVLRPKVRSYFGLPKAPGLTDILAGTERSAQKLAWYSEEAPLQILSEGTRDGGASDLYASESAVSFFSSLTSDAPDRLVIIDAPPMLATTEAFALAQNADEIAFVVEADATPEPAIAIALDELLDINPNVSLILNRCLIPGGGAHYGSYDGYERPAEKQDSGKDDMVKTEETVKSIVRTSSSEGTDTK
ncbi:MAG: hypothetical protein AAF720_05140 [Pseudomonadota bacterium]